MMSTESKDLISLVEKLRQEQEFVSFYKNQVRLGVQELNTCCDSVFHSLWLSHTLSYGLHRVLAHHLHTFEWSIAFGNASSVNFVNASQAIQSSFLVERYGQFLSALLNDPKVLAEVLRWAEMEGLDCNCLVSDLMSVVYGHCVFQRDHTLFLLLLKELLRHLVKGCDSPKDLFSGVESVFNRALSEYCSQLVELRTFLTEALQEPLMQVLTCEDYLEYDVNKAGSRFQASTEGQTGPLVDTTTFLFSEDLESSCEQLAKLAMMFVESLVKMLGQFPLSLRWLLGNLKSLVHQKWSGISPTELRRPVSDILFGSIISSAIVNPDSYGIVDPTMVIGPIARYNLSQITAVLQGCAWILDKPSSSKYPIHKVVKRMNVKLICSLMDSVDGGYREDLPDLPSSLPGLKRSAYLASQGQLNNLAGLVCAMATSLSDKEDGDPVHSAPSSLLTHVPPPMRELASRSPYSIQTKTLSFPAPSRQESGDTKTTPKRKTADSHRASRPVFRKKRANSTAHTLVMDAKSPSTAIPRSSTFGHAVTLDTKSLKQSSEKQLGRSISQSDSLVPFNFQLPQEVLVIPILDQVDVGRGVDSGGRLTATLWDFDLLSEEEFMGQRSRTPTYQRVERLDPAPDEHNPSSSTTKLPPTPDNSLASTDEASAGSRHLHTPTLPKWDHSIQQEPPSPDVAVNHDPPSSTHSPRLLSFKKSHSPVFGKSAAPVQTPTSSPSERRLLQKLPTPHMFSPNQTLQPVTSPIVAVGEVSGADSSEEKPKPMMEFHFPESHVPEVVNNSSSLENLLDLDGEEVQEEEEEHPRRFKRLRRLRDRLKWRKTGDQKEKKRRSQSELVRKENMEDVEAVLDFPKRRSRSEVSPPPREEDKEQEESPRAAYKYRRSYTLLTGHITAKYARKKKTASVATVDSKSSTESPKKETLDQKYESVAEVAVMPVAKFKRTLYVDQLKYKLRVALHGIHTPLSSNPVYLQLCADEDSMCDSRYQLMTLLQNALRRSRWQHNNMELALLTELLRMVEPLPNALVQAAVEGAYEDYTKRSGYTAYLIKSHQKFQDAKLQVGAVQTAVNRMRQVQEELFVNFGVRIYLEGQEGELGRITHQMEALLADEKCSLMEECLDTFAEAIQEDPPWNFWEDMDQVVNCLEDHLFAHVYDHVFHPNGDSDVMRDQIFSHHLSQLSETISPTHRSLQIPSVYHSGCPWVSAQKHLKSMAIFKSPRGKLHCVVQSCKILISLLQYAKCGDPPGADDLFPVLVYILIKVNPPSLLSTVQYVRNFAEGQLVGEDAYWWAQFSTAVEFTKTLE